MSSADLVFLILAAMTIFPALIVVFSSNIIHSAFSLLFSLSGVAGLFMLLHADFLAATQILLYVGGILVLILFGVLLTRRIYSVEAGSPKSSKWKLFLSFILSLLMISFVFYVIDNVDWGIIPSKDFQPSTKRVGFMLMNQFVLPLELAALLLLAALNGAVYHSRSPEND